MEEISCRVIQDILPLYVDEVVSSDTKLLVREHLEKCESCRRDAENMRRNIGAADLENFEREQAETLKNLKRSLKQKRIKTAVISVILISGAAYTAASDCSMCFIVIGIYFELLIICTVGRRTPCNTVI